MLRFQIDLLFFLEIEYVNYRAIDNDSQFNSIDRKQYRYNIQLNQEIVIVSVKKFEFIKLFVLPFSIFDTIYMKDKIFNIFSVKI